MQRIVGIALGYEDLIDHDELRHDPVLAVLAGKSTLNRLELSRPEPSRCARLAADTDAIEALFVDLFQFFLVLGKCACGGNRRHYSSWTDDFDVCDRRGDERIL